MLLQFLLASLLLRTYDGFTPRRPFSSFSRPRLIPTYSGSWEAARQLADAAVAKMTTSEKIGIVTGVGQLNSNREDYHFSPPSHISCSVPHPYRSMRWRHHPRTAPRHTFLLPQRRTRGHTSLQGGHRLSDGNQRRSDIQSETHEGEGCCPWRRISGERYPVEFSPLPTCRGESSTDVLYSMFLGPAMDIVSPIVRFSGYTSNSTPSR